MIFASVDFEDRKSRNVASLEVDAWVQRTQRMSAPQPSSSDRSQQRCCPERMSAPRCQKRPEGGAPARRSGPERPYAIPSRKNSDGSRKLNGPWLAVRAEHSQLRMRSPMRPRTEQARSSSCPHAPFRYLAQVLSHGSVVPVPRRKGHLKPARRNLSLIASLNSGKSAELEEDTSGKCGIAPTPIVPPINQRPFRYDLQRSRVEGVVALVAEGGSPLALGSCAVLECHLVGWVAGNAWTPVGASRRSTLTVTLKTSLGTSSKAPPRSHRAHAHRIPRMCSRSPAYCLMNIQFRIVSIADTPPARTSSSPRSRNAA